MGSRPPPPRTKSKNGKEDHMVPLAMLLGWEMENENEVVSKPILVHGQASQPKKGEDFVLLKTDCQRVPGDGSSTFSVFAVFDGHNGASAAIYTKESLLSNIMTSIPPGLSMDEWLAVLPQAMVAGFVKTDKDFQKKELTSGTTATIVIVDGWTVTVACVGDSRCILDSRMGNISTLTVDHRLEDNEEERERVRSSGGEVFRLSTAGGVEIGPLRCWPGGLCLSRSIGDMDVGEFIVPIPHVKQIRLSSAGGRLIIASDGVWDAISSEQVAYCCRGLPAELASRHIVKETLRVRGLRDDTTCIVIDVMPPESSLPLSLPAPPKKQSIFKSLFFGKRSREPTTVKVADVGMVEELFEAGSAVLADRLCTDISADPSSELFNCAICQENIAPCEGISVHAGTFFSMNVNSTRPWEGPFLCASCKLKKDAMEGKHPVPSPELQVA